MNEIEHQWVSERFRNMQESPTLLINQRSKELIAQGKKVYKLGLGQSPFPVPEVVVQALRLYAPQKDYLHVQGLLALRKAVANFHRKKDGITRSAEHVIIGPGSKELLFLLQVVFDGQIIIPSPSWVSYVPQAKILQKSILILNTEIENNWRITADDLERLCEAQHSISSFLLILNYPGNPDGITYTNEELSQLVEVARQYKVLILSDEIYGQLHHEGKHVSIARHYPEGTIISSGLSKWCGAGGWRLGTFSFPPELLSLLKAVAAVASETYTSVSAPIQYAAIQAFDGGSAIEDYLSHVRRILKLLGTDIAQKFKNAGIEVIMPTGGFYLFMDFKNFTSALHARGIKTSAELSDALLAECQIAVLPGVDFNRRAAELSLRLSYVDFDGAKALASSFAIPLQQPLPDEFLPQHCANVLEATDMLVDWVNNLHKNEKNIER